MTRPSRARKTTDLSGPAAQVGRPGASPELNRVAEERDDLAAALHEVLELSPVATLIADFQGVILYANAEMARLSGLPGDKLRGLQTMELQCEDDLFHNEDLIRRLRWEGRLAYASVVHLDGRGAVPVEIQSRIIHWEGRDAVLCLLTDLTEVRSREEALRQDQQALEKLVEERTAEIDRARRAALSLMEDADIQRRRAEGALAEREILLREIHHRVKNNLNTIGNLLYLQAESLADPAARAAFVDSQNRVHSMARIHEHLYGTTNLERVMMAEYLRDLVQDLQHGYPVQTTAIRLDCGELDLDIETAIPCGLLVNELVVNALKHAFGPEHTEPVIAISLARRGHRAHLAVEDNGSGLAPGFDPDSLTTLGFRLIRLLVGQLRGEFSIEKISGGGSRFQVAFPLEEKGGMNDGG